MMKKAAVIGLGTVSSVHLDAIDQNPEITLVGVCDIDPEKAKGAPDAVPFFTDYQEMIRETAPDVVHICLPHYLHAPVTKQSAEMGVNVFLEKPMALNQHQADELVALEAQHPELHLGICLQNRVNTSVEYLKARLDSGELGAVTGVTGIVPWFRDKAYYEQSPWRGAWATAGGGCMINQAIHTLDLMYYLGGDIRSVKAMVGQLFDYGVEVEDTVAARFCYENGARGLFLATIANYKDDHAQIYLRTEGGEFAILKSVLYRLCEDGSRERLTEDAKLPGKKFYYGASHSKLIGQFYRALEENSQNYIHLREGWMSIHLIDAIQASGKAGREIALKDVQ